MIGPACVSEENNQWPCVKGQWLGKAGKTKAKGSWCLIMWLGQTSVTLVTDVLVLCTTVLKGKGNVSGLPGQIACRPTVKLRCIPDRWSANGCGLSGKAVDGFLCELGCSWYPCYIIIIISWIISTMEEQCCLGNQYNTTQLYLDVLTHLEALWLVLLPHGKKVVGLITYNSLSVLTWYISPSLCPPPPILGSLQVTLAYVMASTLRLKPTNMSICPTFGFSRCHHNLRNYICWSA